MKVRTLYYGSSGADCWVGGGDDLPWPWVGSGWERVGSPGHIHVCVLPCTHTPVCLSVCVWNTQFRDISFQGLLPPAPSLSPHTHTHSEETRKLLPPLPPPPGLNRLAGARAGGRNNPSTGPRERARALTLGDGCAVHGEAELGFLVLYRDEERREVAAMFLTQR